MCLLAALSPSLRAQGNAVLSVAPLEKLTIKRGAAADVKLKAELKPGFHVNSNSPADDYLIPLKLSWPNQALEVEQVIYPKPQMEKFAFSANPVSIFSGTFEITTRFKAPANAPNGMAIVAGKLRYQACNNKECLPPRTLDVRLTVDIQ